MNNFYTEERVRELNDILMVVEPLYEKTWRGSDDLIEALPHILEGFRPKRILEFGPGLSSYPLYHYAKNEKNGVYVGIDHEGPFAYEHKEKVKSLGFQPNYTHICPLAEIDEWYVFPSELEEMLKKLAPFDLIIIDGPGEDAARCTARALEAYSAFGDYEKTIWIVDDTTREASGWLAGKWLPGKLRAYSSTLIRDRNFSRITTVLSPNHDYSTGNLK